MRLCFPVLTDKFCLLMFSDNLETKQASNFLYDELNTKDKELLNKLKRYEVIHPENVAPIANEFPEFYDEVIYFL